MTQQLIVIIDPQNDFISPEGYYAKRHSGIAQILDAKKKYKQANKPQGQKQSRCSSFRL